MSEKEQPPILDQKLCVNGCGFFGSSRFSHMCSKCFKDKMSQSMRESEGSKDGGSTSASLAPNLNAMEEEEQGVVVEAAGHGVGAGAGVSGASPPTPVATGSPTIAAATGVPMEMSVESPAVAVASPSGVSAGASDAVVAAEGVGAGSAEGAVHTAASAVTQPQPMETSSVPPQQAEVSPRVADPVPPPEPASPSLGPGAAPAGRSASGATVAAVAEAAKTAPSARPVQKNRKRCFQCHKKVGYTGIACRCNYVFCSLHRYPEQHDCTFDFKTSDRNELKRTVVGGGQFSKLDRL